MNGSLSGRSSEPGINVGVTDKGCTVDNIMSFRRSRVKGDECSVSGGLEAICWW